MDTDKQVELVFDVSIDSGECCRCGEDANYELGDSRYCGSC